MKRIWMSVATLVLCLSCLPALARDVPPALKKKFMKTELGLNAGQIQKIEELTYRADREKLDIHHELQKARLDLQHLMSTDQPNEAKVFSQLEKISKLELKMKKNRVGLMLKIRKLLTREQWEKMEAFQHHRKQRRRERRMRRRLGLPPSAPDAPRHAPEPPPGP
jgi:Spy/CpxP family protein refolding chaperone